MKRRYRSLREFYPFYLSQHTRNETRILHFVGTCGPWISLPYSIVSGNFRVFLASVILAYALAWIGHFFFEHNQPATFKYPWYSFLSDQVFLFQVLTGKQKL